MPSGLLNADIGFPAFTGNESTEEKIGQISQYLYMLLEQLKYSLANIGVDNMTSGGVTELTQTVVNTPININIGGTGTTGEANTIGGAIGSLGEHVAKTDDSISVVAQKANKIDLIVKDDSSASEIKLTPGMINVMAYQILAQGSTIFASNAGLQAGTTEIDGACITTGTINTDRINLQAAGIYPYRDTMGVTGVTLQNTSSTGTYNSIVIDNVGTAIYCKKKNGQTLEKLGSIEIARGGVGLYFGSNSLVVNDSGVYANNNKIG